MRLVEIINKNYENLNENDLYMLRNILENKIECQDMSITQLSKKLNISTSSILRMTKKLGFSGYSEFKFALKSELSNRHALSQLKNEQNYIDSFEKSIRNTFKHFLNSDQVEVLKHIKEASNIYIYGTGWAQKLAGHQLKRLFLSCNRPMILIEHEIEFKSMLSDFTKDDLLIIISLSGNIQPIIESLRILKINEIPTLSITDFNKNDLASLATYNLYYQSFDVLKSSLDDNAPLASSMGSLQVLCELLYLKYVETIYR